MKNTFGNNLTITLFGESHGEAIGCVLDGIAPGIKIDYDLIRTSMNQRRAVENLSTPRQEEDKLEFLSGIKNGITEGTPICILIKNTDTSSKDYISLEDTPRPSHADYTAECKYHGYQDKAGGGHFSGRITAPIVAAGAIVRSALKAKGIMIGTHIKRLHGVEDIPFTDFYKDIDKLNKASFPALSSASELAMKDEIIKAKSEGDSVGGILETAVMGIPAGVGEPYFDTLEGVLSHALFSIPGIKGVEFGDGFGICDMYGSEANDPISVYDGKIVTEKNSSGGINGGISNGMPIIFRAAVKPTPSIAKEQRTVKLSSKENTLISVSGRHDPAIIHRVRAVVDAVTALALADILVTRFGTDYLKG